ncbi:ATP-binding protein [Thiotrichales bacterium 19S9-12]|nr:ATP-binding protein [Thiotrichales bacterium 19S9-11]MCF6810990.1 ATP-binding protein [Thiotrichales bacterium 19S9-12]
MNAETQRILHNLQKTLSHVELAFSLIDEAICWVDNKWRIHWCNTTFDKLAGKSHILLLGAIFHEVIKFNIDNKSFILHQYLKNLKTKGTKELKVECQLASDNQLTYEITYKPPTVIGNTKVSVIVLRNITHEKKQLALIVSREKELRVVNQNLHYQKQYIEDIISSITSMLLILDKNFKVKLVNTALTDKLGYKGSDLIGKPSKIIFQNDTNNKKSIANFNQVKKYITSGKVLNEETVCYNKNGNEIPILFSATVSKNIHDKSVELICVMQDISDLKRLQKEKEQTEKQLQERYQRKLAAAERQAGMRDVANSVLHNIGNVLNSVTTSVSVIDKTVNQSKIDGFSKVIELLNRHESDLGVFLTDDKKGRHILDYLNTFLDLLTANHQSLGDSLAQLNKHITHIKNIVKAQNAMSKLGGIAEQIEIEDVIYEAVSMNRELIQAEGIKIIYDYQSVDKAIMDHVKVVQILVNLIKNSIEALSESNVKRKKIIIGLEKKHKNHFIISVQDNGIGISPTDLNKLFKLNFTTKKNGHGLGLHASALAAQDLGGSLSAKSEGINKGMTMVLELPLKPNKEKYAILGKR